MTHSKLQQYVAGLLSRVVSLPKTVDQKLLHCFEGSIQVILQISNNLGVDLLERLGPWFTLGSIFGTLLQDSLPRHTILHVHIGTPCRQLDWVETVDETIIPGSQYCWLSILHHKSSFWLQRLGVTKPTYLPIMHNALAVSRCTLSVPLDSGNEGDEVLVEIYHLRVRLVVDVWVCHWRWDRSVHITPISLDYWVTMWSTYRMSSSLAVVSSDSSVAATASSTLGASGNQARP